MIATVINFIYLHMLFNEYLNFMKFTKTQIEAWKGLIKSQQLLIEKVEEKLKDKKLPPISWYDILWELEKSESGSLRLIDIGKKVLLSKYNITRIIDRMEREKLVSREACPIDGRGIFACITPKGKRLRKQMWPVYEKVINEDFVSRFNNKEIKQLADFTSRLSK